MAVGRNIFLNNEKSEALTQTNFIGEDRISMVVKGIILFVAVSICTFFISYKPNQMDNSSRLNYSKGAKWTDKNLVAQVSFPIYKDKNLYKQERAAAGENALPVFSLITSKENIVQQIKSFGFTIELYESKISFVERNKNRGVVDSLKLLKNNELETLVVKAQNTLINFYNKFDKYLVNYDLDKIKSSEIILQKDIINRTKISTKSLVDSSEFDEKILAFLGSSLDKKEFLIANYILQQIQPIEFKFSPDLSKSEKDLLEMSVLRTIGLVKKGDLIVAKGHTLNEKDILTLNSYFFLHDIKNKNKLYFTILLSNLGHILMIFSFVLLYLYNIRKRIFYDNIQFGAIFLIFVITSFQAWVSVEFDYGFPMEYLIFLPAYSMLVAIIFDSRTAFYATVTMALLIASIRGNDYIIALIMMFSGSVAAYTVRDIQNRTQMLKSIILIFSAFVFTIFTFGGDTQLDSADTIQKITFCGINSLVSPLITFVLLFILEKTTSFSSNLIYQEYDNLNHSLLKQLSVAAPGTFQHVKGVAALSEACADAIGANTLFVRVASYFHDIGKILHAEYFAENQINIENKHLRISPKQSARFIIEHVTEGEKLAKQYKLPQRITDIILMHHGTTLVKHFYAMAKEQDENVNIADFQYPGPKPDSREAAIIMICDAAEAISRLGIEDEIQLEKMIDRIIMERIEEGQFDECNISVRDLQIIKFTILKNIKAIRHSRVAYKEIPNSVSKDVK